MLRVFTTLWPFIKEFFANRGDELDFTSQNFKPVTWLRTTVTMVSVVVAIFFGVNMVKLSLRYIELQDELRALSTKYDIAAEEITRLRERSATLEIEHGFVMDRCYPRKK